jgi:hypothetical protein
MSEAWLPGWSTEKQAAIDHILETEYVMTWMGLIIENTIGIPDEYLPRCYRMLISHLEEHLCTSDIHEGGLSRSSSPRKNPPDSITL